MAPGQIKILYSSALQLASWPGEHVFQAIETCNGFVSRWERDGFVVQVMPFNNINDCIRATVRLELTAKERN